MSLNAFALTILCGLIERHMHGYIIRLTQRVLPLDLFDAHAFSVSASIYGSYTRTREIKPGKLSVKAARYHAEA